MPFCLWFPGVGSIPPNFLQGFDFSGFQQLAFDYYGIVHTTNFWFGKPPSEVFQYWTDVNTGNDVQFVDGGFVVWSWGNFNVTAPPSSIFKTPANWTNCSFASAQTRSKHFLSNVYNLIR